MADPTLFDGCDPRLAIRQISAPVQRALAILDAARPMGLTRCNGGWIGPAGRVSIAGAATLKAAGFARVDHASRHPRLKITRRGRAELPERTAR